MNAKAVNVTKIEAICGNCVAWQPVELKGPVQIGADKRGMCYGVPATPQARWDKFGNMVGQMDVRPCPVAQTRACLLFVPLPGLLPDASAPN